MLPDLHVPDNVRKLAHPGRLGNPRPSSLQGSLSKHSSSCCTYFRIHPTVPSTPFLVGCLIIRNSNRSSRDHRRDYIKAAFVTVIVRHVSRDDWADHHPQHHYHLGKPVDDGEILPPEVVPRIAVSIGPRVPHDSPFTTAYNISSQYPDAVASTTIATPCPSRHNAAMCLLEYLSPQKSPQRLAHHHHRRKHHNHQRRLRFGESQVRLYVSNLMPPPSPKSTPEPVRDISKLSRTPTFAAPPAR